MRYLITVPMIIGLDAPSQEHALVEVLKLRNQINDTSTTGIFVTLKVEKAKVEKLPF